MRQSFSLAILMGMQRCVAARPRRSHPWVMVWTMAVAQVISWGTLFYAFSLFVIPMQASLGWSRPLLNGALSLGLLSTGVVAFPVGAWIDRHGGRSVMTFGSLAGGLLLLAWASVETPWVFYLLWMLIGITMAGVLYEPAFAVITAVFGPEARRGITALTLVGGFASTVFMPLTQLLIEAIGWRSTLLVLGGLNLAVCLPLHALFVPGPPAFRPPEAPQENAPTAHAMIAAWQLTPSTRNRIADPGLWPVTVEPLVNKDTARVRWRCFDPARALVPTIFRGDTLSCATEKKATTDSSPTDAAEATDLALETERGSCAGAGDHAREVAACHSSGTTAFTVADGDGNVVAVTQTLGTWGGNFYVSPGLGFLYNDKLTSYGTDPSQYGARLPYARHGSTLAPTIVFHGTGAARRPVLAVGAAGNAWITSAVYETLVGVLDFGLTPQQALELPRFLPSGRGAGARREFVIDVEGGFSPAAMRRLRAMGYTLNVISLPGEPRMGYGAAISLGRGTVTAGADPRRSGSAGAVP